MKRPIDYETRLADLKAASRIIGEDLPSRLRWVVDFVREDPGKWLSARLAEHGSCLVALGHRGFPENLVGGIDVPAPIPKDDLEKLHAELGRFFHDLLNGDPGRAVMIPTEGLTAGLVRASRASEKPARFGMTYGYEHARTAVFHAVKDLVLACGDRLLACSVCHRPFLATGKRRYCSRECTNKAAWANYPDEKKRQRRQSTYEKNGWTQGKRKKARKGK